MGYIRHHGIAITGFKLADVKKLRKTAVSLFGQLVSNIIKSEVNGYISFFIAPDGSKEGWEHSNVKDEARKTFMAEVEKTGGFDYVEFFYGDDEGEAKILKHN